MEQRLQHLLNSQLEGSRLMEEPRGMPRPCSANFFTSAIAPSRASFVVVVVVVLVVVVVAMPLAGPSPSPKERWREAMESHVGAETTDWWTHAPDSARSARRGHGRGERGTAGQPS